MAAGDVSFDITMCREQNKQLGVECRDLDCCTGGGGQKTLPSVGPEHDTTGHGGVGHGRVVKGKSWTGTVALQKVWNRTPLSTARSQPNGSKD